MAITRGVVVGVTQELKSYLRSAARVCVFQVCKRLIASPPLAPVQLPVVFIESGLWILFLPRAHGELYCFSCVQAAVEAAGGLFRNTSFV